VDATKTGLVALTTAAEERREFALWESADGNTWTRLGAPDLPAKYEPRSIEASGKRLMLHAFEDLVDSDSAPGRVWVTTDRRKWMSSEAGLPFLALTGWNPTIVGTNGGFAVLGPTIDGPTRQVTANGRDWHGEMIRSLPGQDVFNVINGNDGLVAIGLDYDEDGAGLPALAVSRDGLDWFGSDELTAGLRPSEGNVWAYDAAMSGDTVAIGAYAWHDKSRICEEGECPPALIVTSVPAN
jgi:hypothetical protein